jgi:hypothetical protein
MMNDHFINGATFSIIDSTNPFTSFFFPDALKSPIFVAPFFAISAAKPSPHKSDLLNRHDPL